MEIKMVDLYNQYLKIKTEIDNSIAEVIKRSSFVKGEEVKIFEQNLANYLGIKHVIACGNGTDALQLALMALDLNEGDEVITTDFTFIATIEVIALLKLKPVLVDIDVNTFLIDTAQIEEKITEKTRVIIPVHLFGQSANMEEIIKIARKYNLYVIEDAAQSLGCDIYLSDGTIKKSGTLGDIGCTSFFPTKNLACFGDGGAVFTNNDDLAFKIRAIANHGMTKRYYHQFIGVNSRLDGIQASILNVKLKYLDTYINSRINSAKYYNELLKDIDGIITPHTVPWSNHTYHQYSIIVKNNKRDNLIEHLNKHNIPSMIYYPLPVHKQPAYKIYNYNDNMFKNSNYVSQNILSLPMHTELTPAQIEYIANALKNFSYK
ncbi:MAG: DegT/DnrJ/EryC1/StrS family aminotransferase [Bacteroidales bacterium]|nr:DegT/DnrJ/EryC1/StrS family aminotransferase [Bacteroidales bacterium]